VKNPEIPEVFPMKNPKIPEVFRKKKPLLPTKSLRTPKIVRFITEKIIFNFLCHKKTREKTHENRQKAHLHLSGPYDN
jgi:hypothetical protein